jgi:hypothetical protein
MATKQAVGKFADHTKYHLAPKGKPNDPLHLFILIMHLRLLEKIPCVGLICVIYGMGSQVYTGDTIVVNPEISSGIPLVTSNRWPQPASRPEVYSTPATKGKKLRTTNPPLTVG